MDWTIILKAQQADFIQRLQSGDLLNCDKEGKHSELTVISGERLKQLRDFCWEMAEKYRRTSSVPIRNVFVNNMKGKLGEEVVKTRLGDFVTEVDYEKRIRGDGKVDFTLTSDSFVGIQVKARYGHFDTVQWSISPEEIKKNAVLVCILIQEEVSEAETEYHLILAGFFPTNMIIESGDKFSIGINELLYCGGLRIYLESFKFFQPEYYTHLGDDCFMRHDYQGAITNYSQVLQINPNNADAYYQRANARYDLGDRQGAIEDYNQALRINPACIEIYYKRGLIRYYLGDKQGAIEDYTQPALSILTNSTLYEFSKKVRLKQH